MTPDAGILRSGLCSCRKPSGGVAVHRPAGPSAVLTALVLSGLDTDQFAFLGFPPRNSSKRRQWLETFRSLPLTLVFYEAPHRLQGCLKDLLESLGDRQIAVARELTKQFEEVRRGALSEMVRFYAEHEPRGEFVLVVAGCSDEEGEGAEPDWEAALAAVDRLLAQGEETSAAIRQVALNQALSRRELYKLFHEGSGTEFAAQALTVPAKVNVSYCTSRKLDTPFSADYILVVGW